MRRGLLAVPLLVTLGGEGFAMMAPAVYEQARKDAPNVVVIAIDRTAPPATDYGMCQVTGAVAAVERGSMLAAGAPITLQVPCAKPDADYPDGGTIWQRMELLLGSTRGRAWLDGSGQLVLSLYEIVDAPK